MTRPAAWIAAGLLLATGGCASWRADRAATEGRAARLDAVSYARPIEEVWAEARRLLAERGYPLAGEDAKAAGQGESLVARFTGPGKQTRVDRDGTWRLETNWAKGLRYRLEGVKAASGHRVSFFLVEQDRASYKDGPERRDLDMELELVRRVDPPVAERIEAGHAPDRPAGATLDL
jgi:hypothetical protein